MSNRLHFIGYYLEDGELFLGPISAQELKERLTVGKLQPHSTVWQAWSDGTQTRFKRDHADAVTRETGTDSVHAQQNAALPLA